MKLKSLLGLAAGAMILASSASHAAFELRLTDEATGNSVTIADGGAGDTNALAGVITFNGAIGGTVWGVNVSTGLGYPTIGAADDPQIHLNSVNVSSGGKGTLKLELSQTDFDLGTNRVAFNTLVGGVSGGGGIADFQTYLDQGNALYGATTLLHDTGAMTGAFSDAYHGGQDVDGAFSLTAVGTITHKQASTSSFDVDISVPEPGTLAIMGLGLAGLGFASRRRKSA